MKNFIASKSEASSVENDLSLEILNNEQNHSSSSSQIITAITIPSPKQNIMLSSLDSSSYLSLSTIENEFSKDEMIKRDSYDKFLRGNIVQLTQTQAGSLYLQKHIDKLDYAITASLYIEVRHFCVI